MKYQKSLETGTLIRQFTQTIQHQIGYFFSNRVVTTSVIIRSVLFASYQLLRMEKLTIRAGSNLVWKL